MSSIIVILAGLITGILSAVLVSYGNPGNMGICGVCFLRDIAGSIGLHRAGIVQYIRPEIIGLIVGAFISSLIFREFRSRSGPNGLQKFILGMFISIGALVFLGCPIRMLLRLGGGDLNALPALLGFVIGVSVDTLFAKQGYNLGRATPSGFIAGIITTVIALFIFALLLLKPVFSNIPIFLSTSGPGSRHAVILISLVVGVVAGALLQKAKFCTAGAFRDALFFKDFHLLYGVIALIGGCMVANAFLSNLRFGFDGQPIAHSNMLWNFMGMVLVGLASSMAGGCPVRQLVKAGEGDSDAGIVIAGMIIGAAIAHNFILVSTPNGPTNRGAVAVIIGIVVCIIIRMGMQREKL